MNLRAGAVGDDVEDLRRQIESALGGVEEIVKNNGVISVATSAEDAPRAVKTNDDEVVVYVSIKINKGDSTRFGSNNYREAASSHAMMGNHVDFQNQQLQLPNGNIKKVAMMPGHEVNGGQGHAADHHQGGYQGGGQAGVGNGGVGGGAKGLKETMTRTEVTGQAIRPKRRGKGGSRSVTAPTTPVRGVSGVGHLLRSKSVEQNSQNHTKSLENLQDTSGYYRRIRRVRSRQSLKEKVWLPGKMESHNILVNRNYVSHGGEASRGKLQYYYPERCSSKNE